MNPEVREQLQRVKVANIPQYDDKTTHLIIPKSDGTSSSGLQEDKCYLIKVEDYIIHPFDGFTLHDNWNKGIAPKHSFMKVEVSKIMGNMIKVNSVGYDFH